MEKNFEKWHKLKKQLHESKSNVFFHEREVWWCSLGLNIGFEQDGKGERFARPVIILKKFNNEVCWVVPLTTREKQGKYYVPINIGDGIKRLAIISQQRLVDSKRFYQKVGNVKKTDYQGLIQRIIEILNKKSEAARMPPRGRSHL